MPVRTSTKPYVRNVVGDENAPEWWTLEDTGGNEVDVAHWPDQD